MGLWDKIHDICRKEVTIARSRSKCRMDVGVYSASWHTCGLKLASYSKWTSSDLTFSECRIVGSSLSQRMLDFVRLLLYQRLDHSLTWVVLSLDIQCGLWQVTLRLHELLPVKHVTIQHSLHRLELWINNKVNRPRKENTTGSPNRF